MKPMEKMTAMMSNISFLIHCLKFSCLVNDSAATVMAMMKNTLMLSIMIRL